MLPVAHHDPLTLLSIYTHVMGWFPKVFKRTRSEQSAGKPPRALTWRNQTLMGGSGQQGESSGAADQGSPQGAVHGWNLCSQHGAARQGAAARLPAEDHQQFWDRWGLESRIADPGVPHGPVRLDLGKQERTPSCQTTAGLPAPQQGHSAGPYRWSADWCTADAAMGRELMARRNQWTFGQHQQSK